MEAHVSRSDPQTHQTYDYYFNSFKQFPASKRPCSSAGVAIITPTLPTAHVNCTNTYSHTANIYVLWHLVPHARSVEALNVNLRKIAQKEKGILFACVGKPRILCEDCGFASCLTTSTSNEMSRYVKCIPASLNIRCLTNFIFEYVFRLVVNL